MNLRPIRNAWAMPSGEGWTSYEKFSPHFVPSPRSCSNRPVSWGVEMTRMSRIPASIRVLGKYGGTLTSISAMHFK